MNMPTMLGSAVPSALSLRTDKAFEEITYPCVGLADCSTRFKVRNKRCDHCIAEEPKRRRQDAIAAARATISPDGDLDFCVPGNPVYRQTTAMALRAAQQLEGDRAKVACSVIGGAAWNRQANGILILGPTGYGKSKVLTAIGLRILAAASAPNIDEVSFNFAAGIRYVSGMRMVRAARERKLGVVDAMFRMAERATLLLFDEFGFEDERVDPTLVRDLLRARYEPKYRPTIAASGAPLEDLNLRYGEATMRTIWSRGQLIELPKVTAS